MRTLTFAIILDSKLFAHTDLPCSWTTRQTSLPESNTMVCSNKVASPGKFPYIKYIGKEPYMAWITISLTCKKVPRTNFLMYSGTDCSKIFTSFGHKMYYICNSSVNFRFCYWLRYGAQLELFKLTEEPIYIKFLSLSFIWLKPVSVSMYRHAYEVRVKSSVTQTTHHSSLLYWSW